MTTSHCARPVRRNLTDNPAPSTPSPIPRSGEEYLRWALDRLAAAEAALAKERAARLFWERQATRDSLTGALTAVAVEQAWDDGVGSGQVPAAVAILDIDHFKVVNDRLGHPAGNQVLRHVVQQIGGHGPRRRVVARLGGDEFLILGAAGDHPSQLADELTAQAATPLDLGRVTLSVGVSVGAVAPVGLGLWATVEAADFAMYEAKSRRRSLPAPDLPQVVAGDQRRYRGCAA